jgi:hypothetical protein
LPRRDTEPGEDGGGVRLDPDPPSAQSLLINPLAPPNAREVLELNRKRSGEMRPEGSRILPAGAFSIQRLEVSRLGRRIAY